MRTEPHSATLIRPLVLGASGRIGTGFQHLAAAGLWPGPVPLWQVRTGTPAMADKVCWDILATDPPEFGPFRGIIALAGVVRGDLALNTTLALAAIDLAHRTGAGPVLLTSSAAVYGRVSDPVDENAHCAPVSPYGQAKLAMEQAVAQRLQALGPDAPTCCLMRIGNVAGADMLLGGAQTGAVGLDQCEDGTGPVRSYVGMLSLARILVQLLGQPALPLVVNVASPRPVQMADLLDAAGFGWSWQPAPATTLARLVLNTDRLYSLIPPDPLASAPAELIRQARSAGWTRR